MCRWFAYLSSKEECLLEDVLVTPTHGLSSQIQEHYLPGLDHYEPLSSHPTPNKSAPPIDRNTLLRNYAFNIDGLGLTWYTDTSSSFTPGASGLRPALYKSISPPLNDFNYRSLCANTSTTCLFAHIRASSGAVVTPVNNHPFVFGRHSFMHNGAVTNFAAIRRPLCQLMDAATFGNVHGGTDSEHMAALYMTYLTEASSGVEAWEKEYTTSEMEAALRRTVKAVIETQIQVLGRDNVTPNSLNLAVTDGERMVAYRLRNHETQQPPTLYWSCTAGVTLNRKYPDHPDAGVGRKEDSESEGRERSVSESTESEHIGSGVLALRDRASLSKKNPEDHAEHIIVASEPSTYKEKEWELIGKNCCLIWGKDEYFEIREIEYEDSWNVQDNSC